MSSTLSTEAQATDAPTPARRLLDHTATAWVATAGRLILAAVFAAAALTKIGDPAASVRAVRAYELLPDWLETTVGRGLPTFELILAIALLLGIALRFTAAVAAGLLAVFTLGIAGAAARGLRIDCGCFGGGGPTDNPQYTGEIVRDVALLVLAVGIAVVGHSRFGIAPKAPIIEAIPGQRARVTEIRLENARRRHATARRRLTMSVAAALLVGSATAVGVAAATAPGAPARVPMNLTASGGILVGKTTAPRTVVIYEDPQCPICKQFEETSGQVLARAVADGKIRVEYRMRSFLGPESVRAVAALGAAQDAGQFDALRAAMFENQPQEHSGGYTVEDLLTLGALVGLTDDAYVQAVKDQTYAAWARQIDDQAGKDGNTGTPEVLVDGKALDSSVTFDEARFADALGVEAPTT